MDLSNFQKSGSQFLEKLKAVPAERYPSISNFESALRDYLGEIETITSRIEEELQKYDAASKRIMEIASKNPQLPEDLTLEFFRYWTAMRLDIKDFFIHTKIFLDAIAGLIVVLHFGDKESERISMSSLLHANKKRYHGAFYSGLKKEMVWYSDFNENRNRVVHSRGRMVHTTTPDGKPGFEIIKEHHQVWGSQTMKDDGVFKNTIDNLTKLLDYLNKGPNFTGQK